MNVKTFIKKKLSENNYDKSVVYSLFEEFKNTTGSFMGLDTYKRTVRKIFNSLQETKDLADIPIEETLKLEASKQALQDKNNYYRKLNREDFRVYNILQPLFEEYTSLLQKIDFSKIEVKEHKEKSDRLGIITLSDLHFNEWITNEESWGNQYNFEVASKRLKKFATECIALIKNYQIKDIYILFLGDLINSNRRLSEKLAQITSQVRASLLATSLLAQFMLEISKYANVHSSFVVGNESRIGEEGMDSLDILASENWDYNIYYNLYNMLKDKKIKFDFPKNPLETIVKLKNGFNALLTHGHLLKGNGVSDKEVAMILQKYLYQGIPVHGVFTGHRHNSSIGDIISRSSSLCGGNAYSANDLGFLSRASQNFYIVNSDLGYHGIKIDLQNISTVKEGYFIHEELERYNLHDNRKPNQAIISQNLV